MGQVAGALWALAFSPRPTLSWGTAPCRRLPQSQPQRDLCLAACGPAARQGAPNAKAPGGGATLLGLGGI